MDRREHQTYMEEALNMSVANHSEHVIDEAVVKENYPNETVFHKDMMKFERSLKNQYLPMLASTLEAEDFFDFSYQVRSIMTDAESVGAMALAGDCYNCLQYLSHSKFQTIDESKMDQHYSRITT